ncbi:hypothetical protein PIB30_066753 [Stylosanthes scabra]|uniref:Uncharacterized protein n=1 Tax=Stylosanthes scabra TaxID=79078 RepID=A0ABU6WN37_9FABA|nr:hypothetical protein [Stylosanthes scabra]
MQDDITEKRRSFSVARVMVDCFQWEAIQEWMVVKCEGTIFDVYVKEFGGEMLTRLVHPEDDVSDQLAAEISASTSMDSIHGGHGKGQENGAFLDGVKDDERAIGKESLIHDCSKQGLGHGSDDPTLVEVLQIKTELVRCEAQQEREVEARGNDEEANNISFVPESIGEQIEVNETRRICEQGDFFLHEGSDDMLLRDLINGKERENSKNRNDDVVCDGGSVEALDEALKTKQICKIGGLSFKCKADDVLLRKITGDEVRKKPQLSAKGGTPKNRKILSKVEAFETSDISSKNSDDMPLAKLIDSRVPKRVRPGSAPKKAKGSRTVPNLGGRNLSTKLLRLGSKNRS